MEIPGHKLFGTGDDGPPRTVHSGDVNAYIKDVTGEDFSGKEFRTSAGTALAALALSGIRKYDSQAEAKRNVVAAVESDSKQLGNTPAICRKCYVHPEVLNAYMSGDLVKMIDAKIAQKFKRQYAKLTSDEIAVLAFLRKRLDTLKAPPSLAYQSPDACALLDTSGRARQVLSSAERKWALCGPAERCLAIQHGFGFRPRHLVRIAGSVEEPVNKSPAR